MGLSARMTVDRIELHNTTPGTPLAMIGLGLHPGSAPPAATLHVTAPDGSHAHFNMVDPDEIQEYAPGQELIFTAQPATSKEATLVSPDQAEPQHMTAEAAQLAPSKSG